MAMTCDEATREVPYRYGLSIPIGRTGIDEVWEQREIDFTEMAVGCGTAEYLFKSKYARDMAEKIFKEQCISTFELTDEQLEDAHV